MSEIDRVVVDIAVQAWDTLFWFAVLVGMSGQLNGLGVIKYFADVVGSALASMNLGWPAVFGMLNAAYFGLHYMFASQTAHVGALYAAFLAMMLSAGKFIAPFKHCRSSEVMFSAQEHAPFMCLKATLKAGSGLLLST